MKKVLSVLVLLSLLSAAAAAQGSANPRSATQIAELISLREKIASPDTRTRVDATHRVWVVGLATTDPEIKLTALQLLAEPVASASDHIRMPAMYAIAEIANSTTDTKVKTRALELLAEPLRAGQVPVRDVAVDVVNSILNSADRNAIALAAVRTLGEPVRSGNNGVRIPAINALVNAVRGSHNDKNRNASSARISRIRPLEGKAKAHRAEEPENESNVRAAEDSKKYREGFHVLEITLLPGTGPYWLPK